MMQDPIIAAIEKYKGHPSVLKVRKHIRVENYFDLNILMIKNGRGTKRLKCFN